MKRDLNGYANILDLVRLSERQVNKLSMPKNCPVTVQLRNCFLNREKAPDGISRLNCHLLNQTETGRLPYGPRGDCVKISRKTRLPVAVRYM